MKRKFKHADLWLEPDVLVQDVEPTSASTNTPRSLPSSHAPAAQSNTPCTFWKLPLELRDIVYAFAYDDVRRVKVVLRNPWETRERKRKKPESSKVIPEPFPDSSFSCLMVSKRYLQEAVRQYLQNMTLEFSCSTDIVSLLKNGSATNRSLFKCVSSIHIKLVLPSLSWSLKELPHLATLSLELADYQLETDDKVPWRDDYTDADIVQIRGIQGLFDLRGLRTVTVVHNNKSPVEPYSTESGRQKAQHRRQLLDKTNKLVNDVATQPRVRLSPDPLNDLHELLFRSSNAKEFAKVQKPVEVEDPHDMLTAEEVPKDHSEYVRLFFARPHAMFKWIRYAAQCVDKQTKGSTGTALRA